MNYKGITFTLALVAAFSVACTAKTARPPSRLNLPLLKLLLFRKKPNLRLKLLKMTKIFQF